MDNDVDSENNISSTDNLHINTEGGPYVGRDANVGRDFAGRDVITITENHYHVQSETNAENLLNSILDFCSKLTKGYAKTEKSRLY